MRIAGFRDRLRGGAPLAGTFVKTPSIQVMEVLALSDLDFVCLDTEHAPVDRAGMDACLALARAMDFPVVVRVGEAGAREILQALDSGAVGVVVPHVWSAEKAEAVARAAHFGLGGRGFAGGTRWAGHGARSMADVLSQDPQSVVIAQIEEPEGVEACEAIAAVPNIDALFVGPADLSVSYGHDSLDNPDLKAALARVGAAARAAGKGFASFTPTSAMAADWARDYGMHMVLVGSELGWMRAGANATAQAFHAASGRERG
ncbi:HpcH/HpaI aldolase family protein [Thetidibacter halocola]|uniref:Aldolase n=1 Tax=Thetidibacter halocola TaxID=2827239 RepID=A0A8J7WFB3_9RHOB|nr:aldolase/citrate lyase family protein [Thetidibacter halocola]MBS0126575.1 aldolase [Thetidibacter halocola]